MTAAAGHGDSMIEAELEELHRRYRIMEGDRKSYAEEVQNVIRKQKAHIEKLKKENGQLKAELAMETRAAALGDAGRLSTQIAKLQDMGDVYTRKIEVEKRRGEELDKQVKFLQDQILKQRAEMGGIHAPAESNQAIAKQIKVLENRLDKALVKFNEAIAHNKELREEIDNLRRERVVFDGIYKKLQRELAEKKKGMANIIEIANIAYEARDQAQSEMAALKAQADKEQKEFEDEWKELGKLIEEDRKRQEFMNKERQRLNASDQRGDMSIEEERNLKKKVTKGHWGLAKDKASIHASMEKVHSYEDAFAKIQAATGISDIDELVNQFIEAEDQNFSLFNYLNELNNEIEKSEEHISELRAEIEKFKGQDKGADSQRKKVIKDLEQRVLETEAKAEQYDQRWQQSMKTVNQLALGITSLCQKIGCNTEFLAEIGGEQGCTESNMMVYLGVIGTVAPEQRTNEILRMYLNAQSAQQGGGAGAGSDMVAPGIGMPPAPPTGASPPPQQGTMMIAGPQTPLGITNVSINAPTTGEEYDSEDESDEEDDRPLSRDELKAKTLRGLTKRESGKSKQRSQRKTPAAPSQGSKAGRDKM